MELKKENSVLHVPLSLKHFLLSEIFCSHYPPLVDLTLQLEAAVWGPQASTCVPGSGLYCHHKSAEMMHTHSPPSRIGNREGRGFFSPLSVHKEEMSSNLFSLVLLLAERDVNTKILCRFIHLCFIAAVGPVQTLCNFISLKSLH